MLSPYRSALVVWMCLGLLSCDQFGGPQGSISILKNHNGAGGSGVVVSDPPGIDCGPMCVASFPMGTTVTLTARPDADSAFVEWGPRQYRDKGSAPLELVVDEAMEYAVAEFGPRCPTQDWCRENPALPASRLFFGVWGTSEKDVWVVGSHAVHWDGSTWTLHWSRPKDGHSLYRIWGSGPNDYWATSTNNDILHWDGVSWREVPDHPQGELEEIWGSGPQDVWIVGGMGLILHWDGKAWTRAQSPTTKDIRAIWGTGPTDAWAVGVSGLTLHWDGISWTEIASNISYDLVNVWGSGVEDYLARGVNRLNTYIYRWDGRRWTRAMDVPSPLLFDFWGSGPNDIWILNMNVEVDHFDGVAWSSSRFDFKQASIPGLLAIGGTGPKDVWIVGTEILHRRLP